MPAFESVSRRLFFSQYVWYGDGNLHVSAAAVGSRRLISPVDDEICILSEIKLLKTW
jgi:hypothetical protein